MSSLIVTLTLLQLLLIITFVLFIGYVLGYQLGKRSVRPQICTIDQCVQGAVDGMLIKAGRDDKIDVSNMSQYTAIVTKESVLIVDMNKHF